MWVYFRVYIKNYGWPVEKRHFQRACPSHWSRTRRYQNYKLKEQIALMFEADRWLLKAVQDERSEVRRVKADKLKSN